MYRISDFIRKIGQFLKNVWLLLSFDPIIKPAFSILCGVFSLIICYFVKGAFYRLLVLLKGIKYIDKGNMLSVCASFEAVALVLLFLIIMTFCALFEIGGLLHAFSMAQVGRRTDIWSMMMVGLRTCRKSLHPRNWLMILFVMALFPLTELLTLSNIAYKLDIPAFVKLGIAARPLFAVSYKVVYLLLILLEIAVLFSINIYVLQNQSCVKSCGNSWRLGRRHLLNTAVCIGFLPRCFGVLQIIEG